LLLLLPIILFWHIDWSWKLYLDELANDKWTSLVNTK